MLAEADGIIKNAKICGHHICEPHLLGLLLIGEGFDRGEGVESRGGEDAAAAVEEESEGAADAAEAVVERRGHAGAVVLLVKEGAGVRMKMRAILLVVLLMSKGSKG